MSVVKCIFEDIFSCYDKNVDVASITKVRLESVIRCSKERKDNLYIQLNNDINDQEHYSSHPSCLKTYTSKQHIERHLKRTHNENTDSERPEKRTRRSLQLFDFKLHCIFCGETCNIVPDKKNPKRWRNAFLCRTSDRGKGLLSFKDVILQVCEQRHDEWGESVSIRVNGAITDLHSADGRYHDDCRKNFMGSRNVKSASNQDSDVRSTDSALTDLKKSMLASPERIWTSTELHSCYQTYRGEVLSRQLLIAELQSHFGKDILVLSSPGIASIVIFRTHASSLLHVIEEDDDDFNFDKLGKTIQKEILAMPKQKEIFHKRIDFQLAADDTSPTLMTVLKYISPKFENSLQSVIIGNIVTSVVSKRTTALQVDLAILANKPQLVEHLYDYGITCSPDEMRRFKISAAASCAKDNVASFLSGQTGGLVQTVIDNFDTAISSQNGLKQTHSLAMLLTQPESKVTENDADETFPRLKKCDLKDIALKEIPIHYYKGPKKPVMPDEIKCNVLPLHVLAHQAVIVNASKDKDLNFLKQVTANDNSPEYAGFNTKYVRESGVSLKPKNKTMYTPLIDMKPSDPSTVMTAMKEARRLTNQAGQPDTIITADQQIYRVMIDISWAYKEDFRDFIFRLGGMHLLMSFVGAVGTLMANSGLEELMKSAFAGVSKMLSGKNFPMNVRALRMVVEELLRHRISTFTSYDEMMIKLEEISTESRTAKHWVLNLIKPVLIMMMYVRAEREGEWPLHLFAVKEMIPYFFASGHIHYARYGAYYLRSMAKLPEYVLKGFMNGEHVMRHQNGLWNGIWSDMYIETTFMRHGKGSRGLVGITLRPKTVKQWALSLHACAQVLLDLEKMRDRERCKDQVSHKEELPGRIKSDQIDRRKIREMLNSVLHPLDVKENSDKLINIYSGAISPKTVNVDAVLLIGNKQKDHFIESLPDGFYQPIKKEVITMAVTKKNVMIGDISVFDTEVIFARVMCLLNAGQIQLQDVFGYELSPIPTSLFRENGEMRSADSKSDLKKDLKVEISSRLQPNAEAVIIDGGAMFWAIHWPTNGTVNDLVEAVKIHVLRFYRSSDVYLIFDRYHEYSIKGNTRKSRSDHLSAKHQLSAATPLPPQKVALGSSSTKRQLIAIIERALIEEFQKHEYQYKFVITGSETTSQIHMGVSMERDDLRSTQEEADVIIIHQCLAAINGGARCVKVVSDDTDVFVLLMHLYYKYKLNVNVLMEESSGDRAVISIGESVAKHEDIVDSLLAAHAISGCDTVAQMSGIGKKTILNVLRKKVSLSSLGKSNVPLETVVNECCKFVAACYGVHKYTTMSDARYHLWNKKILAKTAPKLKSLPSTIDVLTENIKRAHLQAAIWRSSDNVDPPSMDPCNHGWYKDEETRCLLPVMFPAGAKAAPDMVLKLICCTCSSDSPCLSARCSCNKAQMSCSKFCQCCKETCTCCNKWTFISENSEHEDDEEDGDSDNDNLE